MKTKLLFKKPFYVLVGNNGNHVGINRKWDVVVDGFDTKIAAINKLRQITAMDSDIKFGLTPIKVVSINELRQIIEESDEVVNYFGCFDIDSV